jgi:hypothetical protein
MMESFKDRAIAAIQQLPSDATVEEMMERLYLRSKVERGLQQIEAGLSVSHDEAKRRFRR